MPSARYRYHHIIFNFYYAITALSISLFRRSASFIRFRTAPHNVCVCMYRAHIFSLFPCCSVFVFDFISHLILTRSKQRAKPRLPMQSQTIKIYLDILCNRLGCLDTRRFTHWHLLRLFVGSLHIHIGIMRVILLLNAHHKFIKWILRPQYGLKYRSMLPFNLVALTAHVIKKPNNMRIGCHIYANYNISYKTGNVNENHQNPVYRPLMDRIFMNSDIKYSLLERIIPDYIFAY